MGTWTTDLDAGGERSGDPQVEVYKCPLWGGADPESSGASPLFVRSFEHLMGTDEKYGRICIKHPFSLRSIVKKLRNSVAEETFRFHGISCSLLLQTLPPLIIM